MNNNVTIVGNLTRNFEVKFTQSGKAFASGTVAVNRKWFNKQTNEQQESVSFFDVICWDESLAQNAADSLYKGHRVVVTGRLEQRSWENDDGEKRYKIQIVADEISPSLRWATAEVTKNPRNDNHDNNSGGGGYSQGQNANYVDEEPF